MDPVTWYYLITAIVSLFVADDQASKQARAVEKASQQRENDRKRQQDEAFRQGTAQVNEESRRAREDMALFDTLAGEFGGGRSVDRVRTIANVQNSERMATLGNNSRLQLAQIGFDGLANEARTNSQLAAIDRPSVLGSALTIGNAYMQDKRYQDRTQKPQS